MREHRLFSFCPDAKNTGCFMEGKRAFIERRNYDDESSQGLYGQAVDLGDLLQAVRRCRRSVLRTHWRYRGMGELEGTQGTEGSSEEV